MDSLNLEAIVFDFDGVLTDNRVYINQEGQEMVCCNRSDGLAFEVLRKSHLKLYILSTETNPVVSARAAKLKIPVIQAANDKRSAIISLAAKESFLLTRTMFVGNDLNDLGAMQSCGVSVCPSDSHWKILAVATFKLKSKGGQGVVRELVEGILQMDMLNETN